MIKTALSLLFLIFTLSSSYGQHARPKSEAESISFYFPLAAFRDTSTFAGHDTFVVSWYSKHLHAMKEPVLYNDKSNKEIYRFTWLRSFDNPVAIRIERHEETYTLYWKLCDGEGGYDLGRMIVDKQRSIDKRTWDSFLIKLNGIDFWKLPTNEYSGGRDGAQWILEGKTPDKYHVVDRWTTKKRSKYHQACDFLIRLTDLKIKDNRKY